MAKRIGVYAPFPRTDTDTMASILEDGIKRCTDAQRLYLALHRKSRFNGDKRDQIITRVLLDGFERPNGLAAIGELAPEGI